MLITASPPNPPSRNDVGADTGSDLTAPHQRAPRWVKVLGIVALALILVVLIIHLAGGGFRGHSMK